MEELPQAKLYRSARVEVLEDVPPPGAAECKLRQELALRVPDWFAAHAGALQQARQLLKSGLPLTLSLSLLAVSNIIDRFIVAHLAGAARA